MLSLFLAAALTQAAPAAPAVEPPIAGFAKAFTGCIRGKLPSVPATLSPEAGADELLKQCETERAALEQHVEGMIAQVPEENRAAARAEFKQGMAEGRQGIVEAITAMRGAKTR